MAQTQEPAKTLDPEVEYQLLSGQLPYGLDAARVRTPADLRRLRYIPVRHLRPDLPAWVDSVLAKGVTLGHFRANIRGRDVYLLIAAAGYFYMSNRHTLAAFLGENLDTPDAVAHWQQFVTESVLRSLKP